MTSQLLFVHCLSPLHAGTGHSIDVVDLPIAREVATSLPILPGSSIKGSLRAAAGGSGLSPAEVVKVFGPEKANASDHAGALTFGDARLLCLPVRSIYGTFAWATSPLVLRRLAQDASEAGFADISEPIGNCVVSKVGEALMCSQSAVHSNRTIVFEDLNAEGTPSTSVDAIASWLAERLFVHEVDRAFFKGHFVVLHDDVLTFLSRHAIETVTRTSIDDATGTVATGQLWTEENLPAESILVSLVGSLSALVDGLGINPFEKLSIVTQSSVQFGGHATIGRGRCAISLAGGGE